MKSLSILILSVLPLFAAEPLSWSGIYPSLASFNEEGECGTGAVVPWADRLWVITYGPHLPHGSTDKLYEITPDLQQIVRPESVGGTPANRMIHRESGQLIIGPYLIDSGRKVRVIPPKVMPGRLTGNARHLTDPAGKVYFATMEEGIYEVDVKTLEPTELFADNQGQIGHYNDTAKGRRLASLPGYHGKGFYSGQGRLIYANNGETGGAAKTNPATPSGVLGSWDGKGDRFEVVRRNQFTEVTGPGGIHGNGNPDTDPIWSIGWDSRSLILMLLDGGKWHSYRLPKASHCYDGAHGWNTEWPRIRDIGEKDMLMTMHGMFWKFPKTFTAKNAAGIRPRSTYLKVIGDFCKWNDRLVFGCDDTASSAFLNATSGDDFLASPGQSQSNLWFTSVTAPDVLGPALGRGAVWLREDVKAETPSEPFLFAGYQRRVLHLAHKSGLAVDFTLETDPLGDGKWQTFRKVTVPAGGSAMVEFSESDKGEWIRIRPGSDCVSTTAAFLYSNPDLREPKSDPIFAGIAEVGSKSDVSSGWMRARGKNLRTLLLSMAGQAGQKPAGDICYELDGEMKLRPLKTAPDPGELKLGTRLLHGKLEVRASSVVFTDAAGANWHLPRGSAAFDGLTANGVIRLQREISTERYLLNCHGTFYELPTENAGGFAKIRPVSSHNRLIGDFVSYRGLLVMTGIESDANSPHIIRSDDGKAAVWAGTIDDVWKFGKPAGTGGPWLKSAVKANTPSDPYLFTGYDRKSLSLANEGGDDVNFLVQLDVTGEGDWVNYQNLGVKAGGVVNHEFPESCQAYWVRIISSADTTSSALFEYR